MLSKRFLCNLHILVNKMKIDFLIFTRNFLYFIEIFYFFSRYDPAYLDDSYHLWRINLWVKQHFYFTPANSLEEISWIEDARELNNQKSFNGVWRRFLTTDVIQIVILILNVLYESTPTVAVESCAFSQQTYVINSGGTIKNIYLRFPFTCFWLFLIYLKTLCD